MLRRSLAAALLSSLALATPALADTITLRNGREVFGKLAEEKKDFIVLRILGGGTVKIWKKDIATYTDDDRLGQDLVKRRTPGPAVEVPGEGERPGEPGKKPGADKGDGRDLSQEERDAIAKLREKLTAELKPLGASAEDRKKAGTLTAEEKEFVDARIEVIQSAKGSRNLQRQDFENELAGLGPKAVPVAVGLLAQKNTVKAVGAGVLAKVGAKEDERWLAFNQEAPQKLLGILGDQGDEFSGRAREKANAALETLTGKTVGFVATEEDFRSKAEAEAFEKWKPLVAAAVDEWNAAEKKREESRKKLEARLKLLDGKDWRDAFEEGSADEKK